MKDAPTGEKFLETLMSKHHSPLDVVHILNSLQEIERVWVGALVDSVWTGVGQCGGINCLGTLGHCTTIFDT